MRFKSFELMAGVALALLLVAIHLMISTIDIDCEFLNKSFSTTDRYFLQIGMSLLVPAYLIVMIAFLISGRKTLVNCTIYLSLITASLTLQNLGVLSVSLDSCGPDGDFIKGIFAAALLWLGVVILSRDLGSDRSIATEQKGQP